MRCRRQLDENRVARPHLAFCQDDGHDAGLADESPVFISPQHCGHQPWLEAVQLEAGVPQTSTSTTAVLPKRKRVPVGSPSRSMPRVVTFSPICPADTTKPVARSSSWSSAWIKWT